MKKWHNTQGCLHVQSCQTSRHKNNCLYLGQVVKHQSGLPSALSQKLCDCAGHYCFPGVPEMWIYYVYEAIRDASWKDF